MHWYAINDEQLFYEQKDKEHITDAFNHASIIHIFKSFNFFLQFLDYCKHVNKQNYPNSRNKSSPIVPQPKS